MNKLGINYSSFFGVDTDTCFGIISDAGFDAFFTGLPESTDKVLDYAKQAQVHGLFYESIHAPFKRINDIWSDGEDGDAMEKQLTDCIMACSEAGIPIAVMHLSSGDNAPCINDTGHRRFDRIVDCAVKNNVTIAFENQRKLANIAFVFELYENVPNVGFCWDVGHEKCFTDGREYMPLFGKKLVYTHIHDNYCEHNGDLHLIPFEGKIDFEKTAAHLVKNHYKGTLTLEVACSKFSKELYKNLPPDEFYKRAHDAAVKLRNMCRKQA